MTEELQALVSSGLPEISEGHTYSALVRGAGLEGFKVVEHGDARLLVSPAARSALVVNRVIGWGVGGTPDAASLDRIVHEYGDAGFGIELGPQATSDAVLAALKSRGFRRLSSAQVLVRAASQPTGRYESWARGTGLRVEAVGPEQATEIARLSCDNFKLSAAVGSLLSAGARGPGWRRWLAFDGDVAVGASLTYIEGDVAWFGWTSVLPSHRGRWVHVGIAARQLDEAAAAGCRWATTETARSTTEKPDPAYVNLYRFGFVDAYVRPTYVRASTRSSR